MTEQPDLFTRGLAEGPARGMAAPIAKATPWGDLAAGKVAALDELEVLKRLLARGSSFRGDAGTLAAHLLARFGGVARVLGAPQADLARVAGAEVANDLGFLHALLLQTLAYPLRQREVLSSWEAVKTYVRARLVGCPREAFHVLFLDRKNQLIGDEQMAEGTVDHAPVYPREVVRRALELSAAAIVLAHNHPSGDATPSKADIEMTQQVMAAAKALQITVHDHLVVGANEVVSLRTQGLM